MVVLGLCIAICLDMVVSMLCKLVSSLSFVMEKSVVLTSHGAITSMSQFSLDHLSKIFFPPNCLCIIRIPRVWARQTALNTSITHNDFRHRIRIRMTFLINRRVLSGIVFVLGVGRLYWNFPKLWNACNNRNKQSVDLGWDHYNSSINFQLQAIARVVTITLEY